MCADTTEVKVMLAVAIYLCFVIALGMVASTAVNRDAYEIDGADEEL